MLFLRIIFLIAVISLAESSEYAYAPYCPNANADLILTEAGANKHMYFVLQIHTPALHRRRFTVNYAAKGIGTDSFVDFKKRKTMIYMDGFMDSQHLPFPRIFLGNFAAKGYNTIAPDAQKLYSQFYPLAVRASYQVANVTATLMRDLMQYGLKAEDITLTGISLGGETLSLVAKHFTRLTGQKVKQIFSMDPSGPCFRGLSPEYRLTPTDADNVQVIHTSNDGFGNGIAQGHVDFYINGGEWQQALNPYQPVLDDLLCHLMAGIYLYISLFSFPDKFVGIKCKNVQQAREHKCYDNQYPYETNLMGFKVNYGKPGIYYIPVMAQAPLYAPDDFMEKKIVYPLLYNDAVSDLEHFVLSERVIDYNLAGSDVVNLFINNVN